MNMKNSYNNALEKCLQTAKWLRDGKCTPEEASERIIGETSSALKDVNADYYTLLDQKCGELFEAIEALEMLYSLYKRGILIQKIDKFPPAQDEFEVDEAISRAEKIIIMRKAKQKRNFENYKTRHEAYLAFKALKKNPYWFEDDGIKAYIAVDFHEWLWLPVQDSPAYPVEWKKQFIEGWQNEN